MAILNIRNLPENVHASLRLRAAKSGRSMEAEARDILTAACIEEKETLPAESLQTLVDELYKGNKPADVTDALIRERREEARREADKS